jgi:hypothetical protein
VAFHGAGVGSLEFMSRNQGLVGTTAGETIRNIFFVAPIRERLWPNRLHAKMDWSPRSAFEIATHYADTSVYRGHLLSTSRVIDGGRFD